MYDECHIIWSNYDLNLEDWRGFLEEEYPGRSDKELEQLMYERNNECLSDERMNLDIDVGKPILVIADLGLWTGRQRGYREITSGNIQDCLYSHYDYTTWYVDKAGDFRCDDVHHDGTNHYLYRAFRKGVTEEQIHALEDKLVLGTATQSDIDCYTRRLGDEIGKVYGWEFPLEHKAEKQQER